MDQELFNKVVEIINRDGIPRGWGSRFRIINELAGPDPMSDIEGPLTFEQHLQQEKRDKVRKILDSIRRVHTASSTALDEMIAELDDKQNQLRQARNTFSALCRHVEDFNLEIEDKKRHLVTRAIETIRNIIRLPEILEGMRPIKESSVESSLINFTTYPFGMRGTVTEGCSDPDCDCGDDSYEETFRVQIPSMIFSIDLTQDNFEQAVSVGCVDVEDYFHPHINSDMNICWGEAAIPIAEAWGRRDWESMVRLILAWVTQYNDDSPYANLRELYQDYLEEAIRTGWLIPSGDSELQTA